jgi:hypothetical protein
MEDRTLDKIDRIFKKEIKKLPIKQKIKLINEIKKQLHEISPFASEPVDCVLWVENEDVQANDYNPNSVAYWKYREIVDKKKLLKK